MSVPWSEAEGRGEGGSESRSEGGSEGVLEFELPSPSVSSVSSGSQPCRGSPVSKNLEPVDGMWSGGRTGLDIRVGNGVKVEKGIGRREWVGWARNRVAQSGMEVSLRRCRATLAVASRRRDCESSDSGKRRALAYRGKVSGNALV